MGDVRAQPGAVTPNSASSDMSKLVGSIPVVGKFLSAFFEVSSKAKVIVLAVLFLLIIYPVVSLAAALLIISKSPSSVQTSARNYILSSIGVNDRVIKSLQEEDKRFDRSNQVIDASIPFAFSSDPRQPQYTEKVAADQKITFDALLQTQSLDKTTPECLTAQRPSSGSFGTLIVTSYESQAQYSATIPLMFDRSINVGTFSEPEWKRFQQKSFSGHTEAEHHMQLSITPDTALAKDAYLKCNRIVATVYMNMFKLPIDYKAA